MIDGLMSLTTVLFSDVSALMAIANAVQATAPSDRPIKCPLCLSIIKHARNLRRHVFKRHLPAAQRGEITEDDVKRVLENKVKTITVTPLTAEELRLVQQRTRKKGLKSPRKLKGVAALPSGVNVSNINETEITIRKLPQKKMMKDKPHPHNNISIPLTQQQILSSVHHPQHHNQHHLENTPITSSTPLAAATLTLVTNVLSHPNTQVDQNHHHHSNHDILQQALAARDKDPDPQDEVMDLATSQQQFHQPIHSVVVSHQQGVAPPTENTGAEVANNGTNTQHHHPVSLTLSGGNTAEGVGGGNNTTLRIQAESPTLTLHRESPTITLHREITTMPAMAFDPQGSISTESMATTYHTTSVVSPSQGGIAPPQSTSPVTAVAGYIPGSYWTTSSGMTALPNTTFQPHQSVFTPAHAEYFTGMHIDRINTALERSLPQHRRKPY